MLPEIRKKQELLPVAQLRTIFSQSEMEIIKISSKPTLREWINSPHPFMAEIGGKQTELNGEQYGRFKIGQTLELCYKMIELPREKFPTGEEAKLIALNVQKYHTDLSIEDIFYAFELAANEIIPVNIIHYHTVGVKYVTAVLRAYKIYRVQKARDVERKLDNFQTDYLAEYHKSLINSDKAVRMMIWYHYHMYISGRFMNCYMTGSCYDLIEQLGLITIGKKNKLKFVAQAKKNQMQHNRDVYGDAMKDMNIYNPNNDAKVLTLQAQFRVWQFKRISKIDLGRILAEKKFTLLPINVFKHAKKIKQYVNHNQARSGV